MPTSGSGSASGVVTPAGRGWPAAADLQNFLAAAGLWDALTCEQRTALDLAGACDAVRAEFEQRTGWNPSLGAGDTRTFDPPGPERGPVGPFAGLATLGGGRRLSLNGGLLSLTSLTTGVTDTDPGRVLTLGTDFWLRPDSAPGAGWPHLSVEFRAPQWGEPQSVKVVGTWGRWPAGSLPAHVFNAAQQYGFAQLAPQLALNISGGIYQRKTLNTETRYGGSGGLTPLSAEVRRIGEAWEALVTKNSRTAAI